MFFNPFYKEYKKKHKAVEITTQEIEVEQINNEQPKKRRRRTNKKADTADTTNES